jgi:hypothetical protein
LNVVLLLAQMTVTTHAAWLVGIGREQIVSINHIFILIFIINATFLVAVFAAASVSIRLFALVHAAAAIQIPVPAPVAQAPKPHHFRGDRSRHGPTQRSLNRHIACPDVAHGHCNDAITTGGITYGVAISMAY